MNEMDAKTYEVLSKVLHAWKGRWPKQMPKGYQEAIKWWLELQEPADAYSERAHAVPVPKSEDVVWRFPYIDRVSRNLKAFLMQPEDYQRLICSAAEDGIHWRGDSEVMFRLICMENVRMGEVGRTKYVAAARAKLREVIGRTMKTDPVEVYKELAGTS